MNRFAASQRIIAKGVGRAGRGDRLQPITGIGVTDRGQYAVICVVQVHGRGMQGIRVRRVRRSCAARRSDRTDVAGVLLHAVLRDTAVRIRNGLQLVAPRGVLVGVAEKLSFF